METIAVVLKQPAHIELGRLALTEPTADDVVVDVDWSGVSTGTERLLWSGRMPRFPGMGYPLVPGYESVGRVVEAGSATKLSAGQRVFVPGAKCFGEVRGLFGASASRLVVPAKRVVPLDQNLGDRGILLALAATAYHAIAARGASAPDCIVGHGVLGRLLARISIAVRNDPPVVWEKNPARIGGTAGYGVIDPEHDTRHDYKSIYGGEIVLAGFYSEPLSFAFPPAFMREARIRVAAEWQTPDLTATKALIESGRLSLDGLITHHHDAASAPDAYRVAFEDPACLKMVLNWSSIS
jgi:3-hydroxyethyl bacteriochlorophyllide a dehydrogenase